jgi:trimeric autotransporter adhesin
MSGMRIAGMRIAGSGRLFRGARAALVLGWVAGLLAGAGQAAAAGVPAGGPAGAGAAAGVISAVAGGPGGPARATRLALTPCGVSFDAGEVYVGAWGTVRQVNPQSDRLTTPAGSGLAGPLGDGGLASRASMGTCWVARDAHGNLVIADNRDNRIRVVAESTGMFYGQAMRAGHIYSVAGNGRAGDSGDGGPATSAEMYQPAGVTVDAAGNILIAVTGNSRIRVVAEATGTFYGQAMIAGDIYTVAGTGTAGYNGDAIPATSAELNGPAGVALDAAGNIVIADGSNERIRVVAEHTGSFYGQAMIAGDIYTVAGTGTAGYNGDAIPATSAEIHGPDGVAVDAAGTILIADPSHARLRVVAEHTGSFYGQAMIAGDIYTIAGTSLAGYNGEGIAATIAELNDPDGVAVDAAGNVLISDAGNDRVRVVAASTGSFYGQAMTAGDIYAVAGDGTRDYAANGAPATSAQIRGDSGVAVDAAGNLVIPDGGNNLVQVVAESTGSFYGRAMTAGDIYTVAGDGRAGFTGDGGPATSAEISNPNGVGLDAAGNILIADTGNERIRVVAEHTGSFYGRAMTAGDIYSVAGTGGAGYNGDGIPATSAELNFPGRVTVDHAGNLVISEGTGQRIRVVAESTGSFYGQAMTAGDIYTVAGDGTRGYNGDGIPATSAELNAPSGLVVDAAGNLVFSDGLNERIRVVAVATGSFYGQAMIAGDIYTIAGDGAAGYNGDGIPATSAELDGPGSVALDAAGNIVIADGGDDRIRVVAEATGSFYGQAMIAGDIYTVAGTGTGGYNGEGIPATRAELNGPDGVAVDAAGNILIADASNGLIRMVTG